MEGQTKQWLSPGFISRCISRAHNESITTKEIHQGNTMNSISSSPHEKLADDQISSVGDLEFSLDTPSVQDKQIQDDSQRPMEQGK
jgi:hypothetical protein